MQIINHPIIDDLLAQIREQSASPATFRQGIRRIASLLLYEVLRQAPQNEIEITTPLESMRVRVLNKPITIVPILRAGLSLADGMLDLLPDAKVGHIGLFRDESTLTPVTYYEKLPSNIAKGPVILADPMLATGGSACAAIDQLKAEKCTDIRMVCVVATPEGITAVEKFAPDVPIFTAALDRELNDTSYILPGLGDAGDRSFGTDVQ
jgi:uracil phosphoribosyltransferase